MPQTITRGYKTLLDEASAKIQTLPIQEAIALHGREDVVFVDLRDPRELEREGRIPGA
ncbi:MAG TPA: rhodanese-like domain-containing protein, partial [Microvirga sp.]|nr:rhodanese-like domain-containing protein [Microvirga sp.]